MDSLIKEIQEKCEEIIRSFKASSKTKYFSSYIISSIRFFKKAITDKSEDLDEKIKKVSDSLEVIDKQVKILHKKNFFDTFGNYEPQQKIAVIIIDEITHINQSIYSILSEKKGAENKGTSNLSIQISDLILLDQALASINENKFKNSFKNMKDITHEFTYIYFGLAFSSNNMDKSEEKKKKIIIEEEKKEKNETEYPLSKEIFEQNFIEFVKTLRLNNELYSEDSLEEIYQKKLEKIQKINIEDLDKFFSTFHPFEDRRLELKLFKSPEFEEITIKINKSTFQINNSEPIPLKKAYMMTFGREMGKPDNKTDFQLGGSKKFSKKQFELKFSKNGGVTIKCFSKGNHTSFLLNDQQPMALSQYSLITLNEGHNFYIRETEKTPLDDPNKAFEDGPYLIFKGIGEKCEYCNKKILIKTEGSKVDENKEDFCKKVTLKKGEFFVFGKDLRFNNDNDVNEQHAKIFYDKKKDKWFIQGGFKDDEKVQKFKTKLAVSRFDEEDTSCSPKEINIGNMVNVENYTFLVKKIK